MFSSVAVSPGKSLNGYEKFHQDGVNIFAKTVINRNSFFNGFFLEIGCCHFFHCGRAQQAHRKFFHNAFLLSKQCCSFSLIPDIIIATSLSYTRSTYCWNRSNQVLKLNIFVPSGRVESKYCIDNSTEPVMLF